MHHGTPFTKPEANQSEAAEHSLKAPEHSEALHGAVKDWMESAKGMVNRGEDGKNHDALKAMGLNDFHISNDAEGAQKHGVGAEASPREKAQGAGADKDLKDPRGDSAVAAGSFSAYESLQLDSLAKSEGTGVSGSKNQDVLKWKGTGDAQKHGDTSPPAEDRPAAQKSSVTYDAEKRQFQVHY
jgi:hypothetical protein